MKSLHQTDQFTSDDGLKTENGQGYNGRALLQRIKSMIFQNKCFIKSNKHKKCKNFSNNSLSYESHKNFLMQSDNIIKMKFQF